MRYLLAIDVCGAVGSIALAELEGGGRCVASASLPGRAASELLVGTIRGLLDGEGIDLERIGAVAVVHGPGSFTGVRVGVSAAKGLCDALGVGLVAVSRLAVLAAIGFAEGAPGPVYAVLDAGRGEFYCGVYAGSGTRLREALLTRDELFDAYASVAGSVVTCEAAIAQGLGDLAPRLVREPAANDALAIASARTDRGDFDDVATLDANYLRRTDLEIFAKAGLAQSRLAP